MSRVRMSAIVLALSLVAAGGGAARADDATGTLKGTVRDEDNGDRLPGASLLLVGTTTGCSTDLDGEYRIDGIPPGTYEVRVSFMGYETRTVSAVVIEAGETETLDAKLARREGAASYTIDDLVVTADRVLSTDVALITERMKSITIGDGISAERISKSPDGTGSDVLKRVTGLSVLDDKFLYVRGMTDRYSTTWIDGVPTSSTDTDVDRRSFTFDVLPASLLSSAVIVKTATPDLPGDFTGGLVQLNTKDIPTERVLSVSASQGWERDVTGQTMLRTKGGGTDWLGIDDGIRDLPDIPPSGGNYNEIAKALPNT